MTRVHYTEITCKSAINRVRGMPFAWSLNPYRGCVHSCCYCYARVTHTFFGLDTGVDFETQLFIKANIATVLRTELCCPSWRGDPVAIGTATDPYQPAEGRYRLTRQCLEVFAEIGNAANITTKGTLIVRDIDVLQELTTNAGCSINISLITLEPSIWQALEPGTPPPMQRLRALERLSAAGISCGIALAPVLPRLTDTRSNLEAVVRAAVDHGAAWIWSGTLHLEPAVRDWLLTALHQHFPAVTPAYVRVYGAPGHEGGARYTPQHYTEALDHRIAEIKQRYGLLECHKNLPRLGQYTDASAAPASTQPPLQQVELPLPRSALAPR